jgi:hypothetical protein
MKLCNVGLKRSISSYAGTTGMIFVFSKSKKKYLSSQFFDLDIENPLGGTFGDTLAKI